MTFAQPQWFWALALWPVLIALFAANERRREKLLRKLVAARLQERLAGNVSVARRRGRFALLLVALACVIASLARPQLGHTMEQTQRRGRDVLLAIDCSRSMLATDLAPNRLARAKLAAQDLIAQLGGDRLGLIAFAGTAFLQAPLTIDHGAVLASLAELDAGIIPRGGTNIAAAIQQAVEAFGKGEGAHRCLIIFTDGEELDADGVAAAAAEKEKMKIFTVGLGSADGSLIPLPSGEQGGGFVKDEAGQIVKSRLDEERLRKIAEVSGGFYVALQSGPAEMEHIVRAGLGSMKEQDIDARLSRRPIERYQWPLAAGWGLLVLSALLGERRRAARQAVAPLLAVLAFGGGPAAQAKNRGVEAYERQEYEEARKEFGRQLEHEKDSAERHFNLGTAAYKAGDLGQALEAFARASTSRAAPLRAAAEYNLGNTLFQRGAAAEAKEQKVREWKDALQHYEQALKTAPGHADAGHNREVVRKMLEELEKSPPPEEQKKKEERKKPEEKENPDQPQPSPGEKNPQDQNPQKDAKEEQQKQEQKSDGSEDKQPQNQPKDGSQDSKDPGSKDSGAKDDPSPGQKERDQKKREQEQAGSDGKNSPQKPEGKGNDEPKPAGDEPDRKRSGEVKAQGAPPEGEPRDEAAEEAQAAAEGKMTEAQAKNLLESLKGEDRRVQLLNPKERRPGRVYRDW